MFAIRHDGITYLLGALARLKSLLPAVTTRRWLPEADDFTGKILVDLKMSNTIYNCDLLLILSILIPILS